jgi:hypothetical protein
MGFDFPFLLAGVRVDACAPLPLVAAVVLPLVIIAPLLDPKLWVQFRINPEVGKVRGCSVYIRTPAYLNLRNVSTVKKLLDCTTTDRLLVEQ